LKKDEADSAPLGPKGVNNVIEVESDEEIRLWQEYVSSHPDATVYHDYLWRGFMESVYGVECYYLIHLEGNRPTGILPISIVPGFFGGRKAAALPYHMYGGLLADGDAAAPALLERAREILKQQDVPYLEMRHKKPIAGQDLITHTHKLTMILELPEDPENLWASFQAKVRNQVRKAEKSGIESRLDGENALEDFYRIMLINMRDLGSPIHSFEFFRRAVESVGSAGRVWTVHLKGRCLAAGITISFRDTVELPWAGSLREYSSLCPNNLLYWSIIKNACETGKKIFDFGRCTRDSGTHRFKKQWGGTEVPLHYQYLLADPSVGPPSPGPGRAMVTASRVWRHLPLELTRLLGPKVVKTIP
jgi:FemAB-related protein (PEP-CTERM system-associated)